METLAFTPALLPRRRRSTFTSVSSFVSRPPRWVRVAASAGVDEEGDEVEKGMGMDVGIPSNAEELVMRVSSRAYGLRSQLKQTIDSSSYDVERELEDLFSKAGKRKPDVGKRSKQTSNRANFNMFVEDIREGILVFEVENDAEKYCDLLQGGCEGIAEVEASSIFDICRKMQALAVLFRRGRTLPLPENLELNLKARKRSLEDE